MIAKTQVWYLLLLLLFGLWLQRCWFTAISITIITAKVFVRNHDGNGVSIIRIMSYDAYILVTEFVGIQDTSGHIRTLYLGSEPVSGPSQTHRAPFVSRHHDCRFQDNSYKRMTNFSNSSILQQTSTPNQPPRPTIAAQASPSCPSAMGHWPT